MSSTACCSGNLHVGTPKGIVGDLHGLPTYIAEPPNGADIKGILVMIPDMFGWEFVNLRLLCDSFAERIGVRCLLPDFMEGKSAHLSALLDMKVGTDKNASWFNRIISLIRGFWILLPAMYNNRFSVCWPRVESFFKGLRESTDLPVGATGYCWGGRFAITLAHGTSSAADGRPLIDAVFTAHPSFVSIPGDIENVMLPVSIAHGTEDVAVSMANAKTIQDIFTKKNEEEGAVQDIFTKKKAETSITPGKEWYEINVIEGARHGFAVRGDPDDKAELEYAQVAEDQAVKWFQKWLVEKK